jgi:hypothetical protein
MRVRNIWLIAILITMYGCASNPEPAQQQEDFSTKTLDRAASIELGRNCLGDPNVGRRVSTTQATQRAE